MDGSVWGRGPDSKAVLGVRSVVSVIVPAYNTEKYIERCINSVKNQSFEDWELLLVDDGSTDQTAEICRKWEGLDTRIHYYYQDRQGQGIARNYGVLMAKGDYIFFLDSDDWIRNDTLLRLYCYAQAESLDMVFFDHITVIRDENGTVSNKLSKLPIKLEEITNSRRLPILLSRLEGAVWDKFYKRTLLEGIHQEGHPYEDSAILPRIISQANRVGQIQEAFYYYWSIREDSTVNESDTVFYIKNGLKEIIKAFYRKENWGLYQKVLRGYSEWMLLVAQNHIGRLMSKGHEEKRYTEFLIECQELLDRFYAYEKEMRSCQIIVWGSYNLRSMVNRCRRNLYLPRYHFGFSNITSLMSNRDGKGIEREHHSNRFRERMIQMDVEQTFCNLPEEEYDSIDVICIDLLEERLLPVKIHQNYITASDALLEIIRINKQIYDESYLASDEWKAYADNFIKFLKQRFTGKLIILVENYLCEAKGVYSPEEKYPEYMAIRETNILLKQCYCYLESHYREGLLIIRNDRMSLEYTDVDYPHGCYPWHQNEYLYYEMADKIEQAILEYMGRQAE